MKFEPTKKLLTALLTASLLLSAAACNTADLEIPLPTSADSTIESTQSETPTEGISDPQDVPTIDQNFISEQWSHYDIKKISDASDLFYYEIYDLNKNTIRKSKPLSYVDIDIIDETVLMIKAQIPDEELTYLFYHIHENKFSQEYHVDLKDASTNILVYKADQNGESVIVIHDIFDPSKDYREIKLDATDCKAELLYRDNILRIDNRKNGYIEKIEYYPLSNTVVDFASYESILSTYHKLIEIRPNYYDWIWDYPTAAETALPLFTFVSDETWQEFYHLASLTNEYYPNRSGSGYEWYTTEATATFGYTYRDLNDDGSDELILLTEDYKLLAIYTMKDGRPLRVEDVWGRIVSCIIDEKNRLHIFDSTEKICVLGADGTLETVAECGIDLPEGMLAAEYMRLTVGLGFTPLEPITRLQKRDIIGWYFSRRKDPYSSGLQGGHVTVNDIRENNAELWVSALQKTILVTVDKNLLFFDEEGFVGHLEIGGSYAWVTIEECENALYPAGTYLLPYFVPAKG
ncbi:MAG: hypothetical protein IJX19_11325 [Clostridia bacterium]|nr:hypothetical protein [Clostridia bacterium]